MDRGGADRGGVEARGAGWAGGLRSGALSEQAGARKSRGGALNRMSNRSAAGRMVGTERRGQNHPIGPSGAWPAPVDLGSRVGGSSGADGKYPVLTAEAG